MKRIAIAALAGVAVLGALLAVQPQPAHAASQILCAPDPASGARGPRQVVNTSSTATPQPTYSLNANGCALFAAADVGFFLAQGFTNGPLFASILSAATGSLSGGVSVQFATLPPNTFIRDIIIDNSVAATVSGGLDIGTTSTGVDVVSAFAVGSSALITITDAALLKRVFSKTASTPLFATQHTSPGNAPNLTFTVVYGYF